jgi:hypothetical protein
MNAPPPLLSLPASRIESAVMTSAGGARRDGRTESRAASRASAGSLGSDASSLALGESGRVGGMLRSLEGTFGSGSLPALERSASTPSAEGVSGGTTGFAAPIPRSVVGWAA